MEHCGAAREVCRRPGRKSPSIPVGVVAIPGDGGEDWVGLARRLEGLGYSTLLMPDAATRPDPFNALGVAAGATSTLRVGTYVAAGPLRTPGQVARCAHSLARLSGDRFDFGIGTGRPDAATGAVRLGLSPGSAEERLADVAAAIDCRRALDGGHEIPVLMTAGSPRVPHTRRDNGGHHHAGGRSVGPRR